MQKIWKERILPFEPYLNIRNSLMETQAVADLFIKIGVRPPLLPCSPAREHASLILFLPTGK